MGWEIVKEEPKGKWEVVSDSPKETQSSTDYQPSPLETGLAAMAPKGLVSALYGAKEAIPVGLEQGFDKGLEAYRKNRDMAREDLEKSEKLNPRAAMIGSIAPYAALPAMGIPATAAVGGISSAIDSKADLTKISDPEELKKFGKDVAIGSTLGGALGAAGKFAPKSTAAIAGGAMAGEMITPGEGAVPGAAIGLAARGAMSPVLRNYLTKKFNNSFLDVPEAVSERYLADPKAVMNAGSKEEVAQKLADSLSGLKSESRALSDSAKSVLSQERVSPISVSDAVAALKKFDDKDAVGLANRLESDYSQRLASLTPEKNSGQLSEIEAHEVKQLLQGLGKFDIAVPGKERAAANFESGKINRIIKDQNPLYESVMAEQAQNIGTQQGLANKFGIKPDFSGQNPSGMTYTDRTMSAMNDLVRSNKVDRKRIIEALQRQGHSGIGEDLQNSMAKSVLEGPGATAGSRKAVMGANAGTAIGAGIGGMVGGYHGAALGGVAGRAVGSAAGGVVDKYGPQIGKKLLDATSTINRLQNSASGSRFVEPLKQAAQRGQSSYAATYFLMQQSEPEFRKALNDEQGSGN